MLDIEGNTLHKGDIVYIYHPAKVGSKYKRLLRCVVKDVTTCSAIVYCFETSATISKTSRSIVKPAGG